VSEKVENLLGITAEKIKGLVDIDSVVGSEIRVGENIIIIPISKISYGFASGGTDFATKNSGDKDLFGGGTGSGVTIAPVGFLTVNCGVVSFLQVESFSGALDRLIAMSPDIVNKIYSIFKNRRDKNRKESNLEK
jgi:sporulation protein YtfJ